MTAWQCIFTVQNNVNFNSHRLWLKLDKQISEGIYWSTKSIRDSHGLDQVFRVGLNQDPPPSMLPLQSQSVGAGLGPMRAIKTFCLNLLTQVLIQAKNALNSRPDLYQFRYKREYSFGRCLINYLAVKYRPGMQCDQIGRFVKFVGNKFA